MTASMLRGSSVPTHGHCQPPRTFALNPFLGQRGAAAPCCARTRVCARAANTDVVERRVADVAVLGGSALAVAAAYSLAKRGKKVLLINDLGFAGRSAPVEVLRPLRLTSPNADMVSMLAEGSAYWRGLQALAANDGAAPFLKECRSLDIGPMGSDDAAAEFLEGIRDACKVAGVRLGRLRSEEISALIPSFALHPSLTGLLQPDGAMINAPAAQQYMTSLCGRQSVLLRDQLVLRGWKDNGSHFTLRASGSVLPNAVSIFEVEQLLLAPAAWPWHALRMFGGDANLQVLPGSHAMCAGEADLAKVPCWRAVGVQPPGRGERLEGPAVCLGSPVPTAGSGAALKLASGILQPCEALSAAYGPWDWQPSTTDRSHLKQLHHVASHLLRGVGPLREPPPGSGHSLYAATPDGWPALGFLPGVEDGRLLFGLAADAAHGPAASPPGPSSAAADGGRPAGPAGSPAARGGTSAPADRGTARGGPEEPRSKPDVPASAHGSLGGGPLLADGYQSSLLLGKMATDLLCGGGIRELDPQLLALSRPGLAARAHSDDVDHWGELAHWQGGAAFRPEVSADAREWAEAKAKGATATGADLDSLR